MSARRGRAALGRLWNTSGQRIVVDVDLATWCAHHGGRPLFSASIPSPTHAEHFDPSGMTRPQLRVHVETTLVGLLATVLGTSVDALTHEKRAISVLGVTSLSALELRNGIEHSLGVRLPATSIWSQPSIAALTDTLVTRLAPPDAPDPESADSELAELEDLGSDDLTSALEAELADLDL